MSKPYPSTHESPQRMIEPVEDAYDVFVRNAVQEALDNPGPTFTQEEARARMDAFKASLNAKFEAHFGFKPE